MLEYDLWRFFFELCMEYYVTQMTAIFQPRKIELPRPCHQKGGSSLWIIDDIQNEILEFRFTAKTRDSPK